MSKQILLESIILFLFALSIFAADQPITPSGKPGLLILTHGSPSPKWNEAIQKLAGQVVQLNEKNKTFHAITAVNMEFAKPDTADGVETLQKAGCDRIIVVPAFICPTSHTHFDVPAALGLYSSPQTRKTMELENVKPAAPKVPVTITQTISESNVLSEFVRDEIKALSVKPEEESLLLIAHGDEDHSGLVEPIFHRLLAEACGSSGITLGDYTFCEVGQSYRQTVIPAVRTMAKERKRVLIVGFYLVSSAQTIDKAGTAMGARSMPPKPADSGAGNTSSLTAVKPSSHFDGIDVRFSERGVIEHTATPQWILQTAAEAL